MPQPQAVQIKKDHTVGILLGILGLVVAVLLSVLIYLVYNNQMLPQMNVPVPVASAVQSPMPAASQPVQTSTPEPVRTPEPEPEKSPAAPQHVNYDLRHDTEFDFTYAVPDTFVPYNDGKNEHRYTGDSLDKAASLFVGAKKSRGETVRESFEDYVAEHGEPDFEQQMEDRYTVRISKEGQCYYKYCVFRDGNKYWFELVYDQTQRAFYETFTKELYKRFELN